MPEATSGAAHDDARYSRVMVRQAEESEETLAPDATQSRVPRAFRAHPRVHWTDATGEHHATLRERSSAGSAPGSAVLISDPTASRLHAELDPRADGIWVTDLGSKNGTFVDGVLISAARAVQGAKITIGSTEIVVERDADSEAIELWPAPAFGPLIGESVGMRELFARLSRIAKSEAPAFIRGETGTGKELVARAIHEASSRAAGPFIVIDCSALAASVLESELFGHTRGAFTDAKTARAGAFEAAQGGTAFLDEIGELPLALQPKILRVLESRTVRRIGESEYRPIDVRFISATHRDLRSMVNAGSFREDLYFRLAVLPAHLPPLRERPDDIAPLVHHFARGTSNEAAIARAAAGRAWLGNVRELRNFVERANVLGVDEALACDDEPRAAAQSNTQPPSALYKDARDAAIDQFERDYVRALLARHDGNVTRAAEEAGLNRTYLHRLVKKHGE
jgi:transcriptional regulator with GAF, ATPase, and Fis domain